MFTSIKTSIAHRLAEIRVILPVWLLLLGLLFLIVNHLSVIAGDPWLIPAFLRIQ